MSDFLKSIGYEFKPSKNYISNHKLMTVAIALIGLGIGLVKADLEIQKVELVQVGSEIQKVGSEIQKVELVQAGSKVKEAGLEIKKAGSKIKKAGLVQAGSKIEKVGSEIEKAELVQAGSKIKKAELVQAGLEIEKAGSEIKAAGLNLINLIKILLWIAGLGLLVTIVIGVVRFFALKIRILWRWMAIVDFLIVILGQLVGLAIAYILVVSGNENMTLWLGIMIGWIGVMMGWYAVLKERMMGMAAVGATILGIILASFSDADLQREIGGLVSPLYLIASNTSGMDTTLKDVEKHTLGMDTTLKDVEKHTLGMDTTLSGMDTTLKDVEKHTLGMDTTLSGMDTTLKDVEKHTLGMDTTLSGMDTTLKDVEKHTLGMDTTLSGMDTTLKDVEKHTSQIDSLLVEHIPKIDSLEKHTSRIDTLVDSLVKQTSDIDSLVDSVVKKVADKTVKELNTKIDQISKELEKAKQVQNSVLLLIDIEEKLKEKDFLKTRGFSLLKSYNLSKKLRADDPLVTRKSIGETFTLKLDGSSQLELKRLVSHLGTLKKDKDYTMVENDSTTITFINPLLGRMDILAVVEKK